MKSVLATFSLILFFFGSVAQSASPPNFATVPVTLDHNRVIIDVYFPQPDGTKIRARAWVDPGDPEMSITNALQKKLGLTPSSPDDPNPKTPGELLVGDFRIDLRTVKKAKAYVESSIAPGSSALIKLPATVLKNYDVVMDFPNREFTIGQPGSVQYEGTPVKAIIGPETGLIQLEATVAGEKQTASFDAAASVSLLSDQLVNKWHKAHPDWPSMIGGVGPANMWGWAFEPKWLVLRIPQIEFGGVRLTNALAAPFPPEYLDWYQKRAGTASIGAIGADVLINFRAGLDYAHSTIYLKQLSKYAPPGIDVVGLTLSPESDGRYKVLGVVDYQGSPAVSDVKAGDVLLTVDNARVTGGTMGQTWSLLGGSPGDTRILTLERDGKPFTVKATVRRFLPVMPEKTSEVKTRSKN